MAHKVEITEAYRDYSAPPWVRPTVDAFLNGIPEKYLAGLKTIVLTNAGGLNHERRRAKTLSRKKKVKIDKCRGLYHQEWKGEPAWIELFVDNILPSWQRKLRLRLFRDILVDEILAHEIGHHIHATKIPEYREREDVADKWIGKLTFPYFMRRHWCICPILYVIFTVCKGIGRVFRSKRRKNNTGRNDHA